MKSDIAYDINPDCDYDVDLLVTTQDASIDWLTVTAKDRGVREILYSEASRWFAHAKDEGFAQRPWRFKGYDGWSIRGLRWGDRKDSSIIMLSGIAAQMNYAACLAFAQNITRIDLAVTVTLAEPRENVARKAYDYLTLNGTAKCPNKRRYTYIENSQGGQTFYVGSRTSDQYGRLYDKGREEGEALGIPKGKIWRYEVEFKAYRAKRVGQQVLAVAKNLESHPNDEIAGTVYKWFLSRGVNPIIKLDKDVAFLTDVSLEVSDDETSLHWLSTQVSPTVVRLCNNGKKDETLRALGLLAD